MTDCDDRRRIGLIVNPVAGMGGRVGLKGTDGAIYREALALGAEPVSPGIAARFVAALSDRARIDWLAAPGAMGEFTLASAGIEATIAGVPRALTTAQDTRQAALAMIERGVALIAVVGGDGTLRDLAGAVGLAVAAVAVPAGVKVYSSAFAVHAEAAARLVDAFVDGAGTVEAEVVDIDESAYRNGRLDTRHFGFVLVPDDADLVQHSKESSSMHGAVARREAAEAVADRFEPGVLYLLGPGTTLGAVAARLGLEKTLLGIDAVRDGRLVGRDLNEAAILAMLADGGDATIVVTPLGGNGFVLGRGNRQLTPEVVRRVGLDRLVIVGARDKLSRLPCLRVDTGDPELDAALRGYREVVTGYKLTRMMRIA